jgi:hypothetical protein
MTDGAIRPLRRRMIEDMTIRNSPASRPSKNDPPPSYGARHTRLPQWVMGLNRSRGKALRRFTSPMSFQNNRASAAVVVFDPALGRTRTCDRLGPEGLSPTRPSQQGCLA